MLAAFRKKLSPASDHPQRSGIVDMPPDLRHKFKLGVNYNMKILIRGDRNVGKSCLLSRLRGGPFNAVYAPTDEIDVASIAWNYKATDAVVKVEIWDVVDQSRRRSRPVSNVLKIENAHAQTDGDPALDASFVDVHQGASGVVLMFDITKPWTWDYVKRELPCIPAHLPVLVLGNRRDMCHARVVPEDVCRHFVEQFQRPPSAAPLRYSETSMKTGLGLKFIYVFLNVPFLLVERDSLMQQLERNKREMQLSLEEMNLYDTSQETTTCSAASGDVQRQNSGESQNNGANETISPVPKHCEDRAMSAEMSDLDSWLEATEESPRQAYRLNEQTEGEQHSDSDDDVPNPLVTQIPTDTSDENVTDDEIRGASS